MQLNPGSFPGCEAGVIPQFVPNAGQDPSTATSEPLTANAADPNAEMHLLSLYTPQARDAQGGAPQIEALIQAAVDNANTSFINSNMTGRYVLVHAALANRNDSGNLSSDLNWLASDPDAAQLRDDQGADMVSLIVNSGGCGIGYVQRNPGPSFASAAFQVTVRSCAVGNLTFAHEHGHNLGFEHDLANGPLPSQASYPWSFGAFINSNLARTVMAYPNPCGSCPRVMHHSNPDVTYLGFPTGVENVEDNARTGDITALIAHDFRPDATPATLASITVGPDPTSVEEGQQQAFIATGHYDDLSTADITASATWASSNTAVATVGGGIATGVSAGTASITASQDGLMSNAALLTVTPPPVLLSISMSPTSATIGAGATQAFTATGHYDDSSTPDITAQATWASSDTGAATVNGSGVATGVSEGAANITASLDGTTSPAASLTVTAFGVAGLAPSVIEADKSTNVTVTGSGFVEGASLSFQNGNGKTPTATTQSVSATQVVASVFAYSNGPNKDRTWDVTLTNGGPGQQQTLVQALTVTLQPISNQPPTVTITSPANGSAFAFGASVAFTGSASDDEDGDISPNLSWSSDLDGTIGSGASFNTTALSVGTHTITASVTDSGGAAGNASISVTITNNPPTVAITSPANGAAFAFGASVAFAGSASDDEDGDISANLSWSSDLDGTIGSGASFNTTALSVGTHTITASVTDSAGDSGNASISVTITNNPPTVTITSPANSSALDFGASVAFAGSASDDEDGDISANLSWSSDLDGAMGSGASFNTTALSAGTHTITASVTDSAGDSGNASITVTINPSAGVTVTAVDPSAVPKGTQPAVTVWGSGFVDGATVSFENGSGQIPLVITLQWVSSNQIDLLLNVRPNGPDRDRVWDVRVTNPDGSAAVLVAGFTILF